MTISPEPEMACDALVGNAIAIKIAMPATNRANDVRCFTKPPNLIERTDYLQLCHKKRAGTISIPYQNVRSYTLYALYQTGNGLPT